MPATRTRSIRFPIAVHEGLELQLHNGVVGYENVNELHVGLARYQLICGGSHPITEAIARLRKSDQDVIDAFLRECAARGISQRGSLLRHLIAGTHDPSTAEEKAARLPQDLLHLARRWRKGEEVFSEITGPDELPPQ